MEEQLKNENPIINKSLEKKLNFSIFFNIILFIGLIIIYYLHFHNQKEIITENLKIPNKNTGSLSIAYINTDSVMENYALVQEMKKRLENKKNMMETEFSNKQKNFETEVAVFQKKIASNSMTSEQAQNTEKELTEKQKLLYELQEKFSQEIDDEQYEINVNIIDSIVNFLKRYNKEKTYDYILGFSHGSGILNANDDLNITKYVLQNLNNEYNKKYPKK